ncbi:MAG: hypothetical protein NVSMB27_21120 [Ktedonobacteraceae bacterium]
MNNRSHMSTSLTQYFVSKSWLIAISILVLSIAISGVIITLPRPQAVRAVPASGPQLTVNPSSQPYFSQNKLRVQGFNYPTDEAVTVYWNYTGPGTGIAEGNANIVNGAFSVSFAIPLAATATYTIAGVSHSGVVATTPFTLLPNLFALPRATGVGSIFTLTGQAFGAGEQVDIYWNSTGPGTGTLLTTASADGTGSFQVKAKVPSNATYGKNPLFGIGQTSGQSSTAKIIVYAPTLALAPLSGSAGTQLSISAYGFQSNEKVSAYWNNGTTPIFLAKTTSNGYLPVTVFTVPTSTTPGSYSVKIVGTTSHLTLRNTFTVVLADSSLAASLGPIGMRVKVSGQGYMPGETVNTYWDYNDAGAKVVASTTASISGTFHVSFLVPTNTNGNSTLNGNYAVAVVGATSNDVTPNTFTVSSGLSASPSSSAPGQPINVAGSGFQANETVNFYWDNTSGTSLASVSADGNGNVSQSVTTPTNATPGAHTIIGVGKSSGTAFNASITIDTIWNDFGFSPNHLRENVFENSLSTSNVGQLHMKWSEGIGSPQSEGAPSPVYYNGLVYIATFDGKLIAYNATTGSVQWQFSTGTNFANLTSPVIDPATNILFFGTLGFLEQQDHGVPSPFFALDAQTGTLLWSNILNGDDYAFPTMAFNNLYVGLGNEGGGYLLSIDETTGYLNAQYKTRGGVWGAVGVDIKTNMIFTGIGNPLDQVLAFNANSFKGTNTNITPLWTYSAAQPGNDDDIGSAMAVVNGMVYVDSKNGYMYALHENDGTVAWQYRIGPNSIGDVSSPSIDTVNNVVYVGTLNGALYALNSTTGALVWKVVPKISGGRGGPIYSSPALANGVVYVASNDGNVYALNASSGAQLWNYTTAAPTFSSPIVVNGWLYCASTDGNLYAFSL